MKRILSLLLSVVLVLGLVTANAVPVSAASDFSISDECVELLKSLEGFDKYPRWDYSQWTVGHGSRCPAEDLERYRANGITREEADALLRKHAGNFAKSINSFIDKYDLDYTQQQFDALLLFTYNFGSAWLFNESSTWRAGLINGVTGNDFMFEIGQWCHAGGEILKPLITRRLIEANIFFNGVYSRTVPDNYCYVIYEFNGGDGETDVQAYNSDLDAPIRVIPTREGYTFAGWYTANSGGTKVTKLTRSTKNMTLYARWVEGENVEIGDDPVVETPDEPETMDPVTVKVTATDVNIRRGPGTNYSVVGSADKGDTMTITEVKIGSGYTWGKFGDNRWIALMYTNYKEVISQQPEEEEPTEPETEPTEPETKPTEPPVEEEPEDNSVKGTVTGSDLRIRSGAGTNYSIVGLLQIGDRVTITERKTVGSMEWGKMEKGWISLTYVKLDEPVEEEPEEPVVPEETEPTEPETEPTEPETKPTEPEEEPEETTPSVQTGKVKVNDVLRIRSGAGTGYSVVGFYGPNASVTILETKKVGSVTWGRTDKGWISMDYVVLDQTSQTPDEDPKVITGTVDVDDFLRVRSGAGTNYSIVGFLSPNERVTVTETKKVNGMTWGKISSGWISMDYVILD